MREMIKFGAVPFALENVRLLPGPFLDAFELNRKYLLSLDPDRLLHTFRLNAGLPGGAPPYGGWEKPESEVRGHSLGHYLSGIALTVAASGDLVLRARADYLVGELAKCQAALGTSGYLSAWPETFIDRAEAAERVWAPYYTLHKILAGLLDVHRCCGNAQALDVASRFAGWLRARTDKLDDERMQRMLDHTEQGGMNEALCNLYDCTGKPAHLDLSLRFEQRSYTDPLAQRADELKGQHCNSFIPNVVGYAREHELTGENERAAWAHFFWDRVTRHRAYATGGTSSHECWNDDPDRIASELSTTSHETCCSYNLLKLTRHLFQWRPDAAYFDYYEKLLINGILSTIDPGTGMTMYYVPMASGCYKTFGTPENSFWCCTGTGMESHAKYGDSIYFRDPAADALWVNLFIASELEWEGKGLRLRQETAFPETPATLLVFSLRAPQRFALRLRVPGWAVDGVRVTLNGEAVDAAANPSNYCVLEREWHDGDRVEMRMPMSLGQSVLSDDDSLTALMYGPMVLAADLGPADEPPERVYGLYGPRADRPREAPTLVFDRPEQMRNPADWIEPVPGEPLVFRTRGAGRPAEARLVPFHRLFNRCYAIYLRRFTEAGYADFLRRGRAEADSQAARGERRIDACPVGDAKAMEACGFQSEKSTEGIYQDRPWVQAEDGGWIAWKIRVEPEQRCALGVTYWGADDGDRRFRICVDGTEVARQALRSLSPGQFVEVEYPIPTALTQGRDRIAVRFEPEPGNVAGAVFALATLRRE